MVKVASVVVSTALELVLIPLFQQRMGNGGIGVVAAFVVSEFVVFAGAIVLLRQASLGLDILVDMARRSGLRPLPCSSFGGFRRCRSWLAFPCASSRSCCARSGSDWSGAPTLSCSGRFSAKNNPRHRLIST